VPQEKERHGCNECHKKDPVATRIKTTREEDDDTVGKEVRYRMKEEDEDLVYKQATTTTGPLSVSRAFEEMTKER